MRKICDSVEYVVASCVDSIRNNSIILKPNFEMKELESESEIVFGEKENIKTGNSFFEQSLKLIKKIEEKDSIWQITGRYLILRLKIDGIPYIWGSIFPYNPVIMKTENDLKLVTLTMNRQSLTPLLVL